MEVTFTVGPEDIWHYFCAVNRAAVLRRQAMSIAIAFTALQVYYYFAPVPLAYNVGTMLFASLLFASGIPFLKPRVVKQAQATPGLLGQTTTSISPAGMRRRNPVGEIINPWTSYTDLRDAPHGLYFFLSKTTAQVVPKRAFATPAEAERFLSLARAYWNAANNGTPLPADAQADGAGSWPPAPRTLG